MKNNSYQDSENSFVITWDPAGNVISFVNRQNAIQPIADAKRSAALYKLTKENSTKEYSSIDGDFSMFTNFNSLVTIKDIGANKMEFTTHYWDGKKCFSIQMENEIPNGKFELYANNGKLKESGNFLNGEKTGLWSKFYTSGTKASTMNYFTSDSVYITYFYKNENVSSEYLYSKRRKYGPYKDYYESGQLKTVTNYIRNRINGKYEYFHENGQVATRYFANMGQRNGLSEQWFSNGKLQSTFKYKNNRVDGEFKEWWENGNLRKTGYYKRERKDSIWMFYEVLNGLALCP